MSVIHFFGGLFTKVPLFSGLPKFCVKPIRGRSAISVIYFICCQHPNRVLCKDLHRQVRPSSRLAYSVPILESG
ncbi:hypothetical protein GGP49_003275 [Salinibacter ruber]|nr:hypothetical protein [Salinibacter ruber]